MNICNLHDNLKMLNKSAPFQYYYYILETSLDSSIIINLFDTCYLIPINQLKIDDTNKLVKNNFFKAINDLKINYNFPRKRLFLLILKVCDLTPPDQMKLKKQEESIESVWPDNLSKEIVNIISHYFSQIFRILFDIPTRPLYFHSSENNYFNNLITSSQINNLFDDKTNQDLAKNLKELTDLRREQYKLIQKGLHLFNLALNNSNIDLSLAYSLLVSCIETFAQKYSNAKGNFEDFPTFINIKRVFESYLKEKLSEEDIAKFLEDIGDFITKGAHMGATAKFCDFTSQSLEKRFHNEYLTKMLKDIYTLRSKFLHGGVFFPSNSKNRIGLYNEYNNNGNIKKRNGDDGYIIIKRIPSFLWMANRVREIIIYFINYSIANKNSKSDIKIYKKTDNIDENILRATVKRDVMPHTAVFNNDIERDEDYFDLLKRENEYINY